MFQKIAKHRANDASNDVHRPPLHPNHHHDFQALHKKWFPGLAAVGLRRLLGQTAVDKAKRSQVAVLPMILIHLTMIVFHLLMIILALHLFR